MSARYDVIVVGGGSAGCAAAARLSEDPRRRVLLLEAGPDPRPLPELIGDASKVPELWETPTVVRYPTPRGVGPGTFDSLLGRVMGGGSSVNWMNVARPLPDDMRAWARQGNPDWDWQEVLPVLKRIEADQDFPDHPLHGKDGPLYVKRSTLFDGPIGGQRQAFIDACKSLRFPVCLDQNLPSPYGICPIPHNAKGGRRQSTAVAYLEPARSRPNLTVQADAWGAAVRFRGRRVGGVEYVHDGATHVALADAVVLCAGVYHSPQILIRSGVGPPAELQRLGLPVACALEGVGHNYQDHAVVFVKFEAVSKQQESWVGAGINLYYKTAPSRPASEGLLLLHRETAGDGGRRILSISVRMLEHHTRGRVSFPSAGLRAMPEIDAQLLVDPHDVAIVVRGMALVRELAGTAPMREHYGELVEPKPTEDFARFARSHFDSFHHGVGTCMMGPASNPMAVVDQRLCVHGLENLWVADASIMPTIPHAPTNLTAIMIGERAADFLKA